jgi:hypothetical protein
MRGLKDRLPFILYACAVAAAGLAAESAARAVFARKRPPGEALREVRARPGGGGGPVSLDRYAAVRSDLFCGLAPPAPPAPQAPPADPGQPAPAQPETAPVPKAIFVLKGTLAATNPELSRAFIEVPGAGEQQAYRIGDSVQGAKVVSIGNDSVEVERDGEKIVVGVSFDFETGPAAPDAGRPRGGEEKGSSNSGERPRPFTRRRGAGPPP